MATLRMAVSDKVIAWVLMVMLVVLSFTTVQTMRQSERNSQTLHLVKECVLPEGHLCKGNPDATQKLLDELVKRVNDHTDQVVGK